MSEKTMQTVDAEVRRIVDEQYAIARKLIEENKDKIEAMTQALLEWETIDSDQINDIMDGRPPRPPKPPQSMSSTKASEEPAAAVKTDGGKEPAAPQEIAKEAD
jgi:cell division protease FtsH